MDEVFFFFFSLTGGWSFFSSKIFISPSDFGVRLIFFFFTAFSSKVFCLFFFIYLFIFFTPKVSEVFFSLNSRWSFFLFQKTSMPPPHINGAPLIPMWFLDETFHMSFFLFYLCVKLLKIILKKNKNKNISLLESFLHIPSSDTSEQCTSIKDEPKTLSLKWMTTQNERFWFNLKMFWTKKSYINFKHCCKNCKTKTNKQTNKKKNPLPLSSSSVTHP